jgi:hypothetical protein
MVQVEYGKFHVWVFGLYKLFALLLCFGVRGSEMGYAIDYEYLFE